VNRMRQAFTLIEVLISFSVMMVIVAIATSAYFQVNAITQRVQARQALFDTARVVFDRLHADVGGMVDGGAWWLRSTGATSPEIELVFLRGRSDPTEGATTSVDADPVMASDLTWTRLRWSSAARTLSVSSNALKRVFTLGTSWIDPDGHDHLGKVFCTVPTPARQAGISAQVTLGALGTFGTGDLQDLSDYADLQRNEVPIATGCTTCTIQAVLGDGSVVEAEPGTVLAKAWDGLPVDGRGPAAASRPRLFRLRFTLRAPGARIDASTGLPDPRTLVEQSFSFSLRTPNLLPGN
jgi:Tfp pilus assembly protein PilE